MRRVAALLCVVAAGCTKPPSQPPVVQPKVCDSAPACDGPPPPLPGSRLIHTHDERLREAIDAALPLLEGGRDVDVGFARHIVFDADESKGEPHETLLIEVVRDARCGGETSSDTCCTAEQVQRGEADLLTVRGVCTAAASLGNQPARLRCSEQALTEVIAVSDDVPFDLPLLFVVGHELSHIVRRHDAGCLLPDALAIPLSGAPSQRLADLNSYCGVYDAEEALSLEERVADSDALWLVRAILDDLSAEGVGKLVPPERGGYGEVPEGYIDERGRELRPRQRRGETISFGEVAPAFFDVADRLTKWRAILGEDDGSVASRELAFEPDSQPGRDEVDAHARDFVCELMRSPTDPVREFRLPTLPGATHPDAALRLALVGDTLYRIAGRNTAVPENSPAAGTNLEQLLEVTNDITASLPRWRAAYTRALGQSVCDMAGQMLPTLPNDPSAVDCATAVPRRSAATCALFSAERVPWNAPGRTRSISARWSGDKIELDAAVTTALVGPAGVVIGMDDESDGDEAAFGLLAPHAQLFTADVVRCVPTALAAQGDGFLGFCREQLAIARLDARGRLVDLSRVRQLVVDGLRVDGFINGDLDRDGRPLAQDDTEVSGFVDDNGVPVMRQAEFINAFAVNGEVRASLALPRGRNDADQLFAGLETTVRVGDKRLLPIAINADEGCGTLVDAGWGQDPSDTAPTAFSTRPDETVVAACHVETRLFALTRTKTPAEALNVQLLAASPGGKARVLHAEELDDPTFGLTCSSHGAVAWFEQMGATTLVAPR